jgi:hypothetical protein
LNNYASLIDNYWFQGSLPLPWHTKIKKGRTIAEATFQME